MRFLAIDPGETTGWSVWEDGQPVASGQTPGERFVLDLYSALLGDAETDCIRDVRLMDLDAIVCEDFVLYPWAAKSMDYDRLLTVRFIGGIQLIAKVACIPLVFQPALIKEAAEALGAEAFFTTPLHENRHENDSKRHAVYYLAQQKGGAPS